MADVIAAMTMSVDGYIAHADDSVGALFDWHDSGDVDVRWPGMNMVSHVTPRSADYLLDTIERAGALVVGRRVYDYTNGWGGSHPLGVPLFLVTHNPPPAWPTPDAPFTAVTEGVAAAILQARVVAGDKTVDEIAVDLAPVLRGPVSVSSANSFAPRCCSMTRRLLKARASPTSGSASGTWACKHRWAKCAFGLTLAGPLAHLASWQDSRTPPYRNRCRGCQQASRRERPGMSVGGGRLEGWRGRGRCLRIAASR